MSDYSNWEKQFNAQLKIADENNRKTVEEAAEILLETIKERTPVGNPDLWHPPYWPKGYVPGTLKASWEISYSNSARDATSGRFTTAANLIQQHGISTSINTISIFNRQPYAEIIEYGKWSTQAPQGMMRISLLEWPHIINSVKNKYIQ